MKNTKSNLLEYRLSYQGSLGYYWQDKRGDGDSVYQRHFSTKRDLLEYLTEYFGAREARRVWAEQFHILG